VISSDICFRELSFWFGGLLTENLSLNNGYLENYRARVSIWAARTPWPTRQGREKLLRDSGFVCSGFSCTSGN
jgi:hypothetical protein